MTEVVSAERIDPSQLEAPQREALSEKLYQIHQRVFAGLGKEAFNHYVVNSPAKKTRFFCFATGATS